MVSNAISAQGSKLEIGTGSGGAKTISGATKGNPCILTATAHGLVNGDRVAIAAVAGMTELNGITATVLFKTANTFAIAVDSTAFGTYTSAGTATPITFTDINDLISFSGFDGAADEIPTTNLRSTSKEFLIGLQDHGAFNIEINVVHADAGQAACRAAKADSSIKAFKLTLPNAEVATFNALVKSMPEKGGVNAAYSGSINTKITGDVTWA